MNLEAAALKIACFALASDGGLRPEPEATAVAAWRAGAGPYWISLSGGRPDAVAAWLADLGLDASLVEGMEIGSSNSTILPLADSLFIAYPVMVGEDTTAPGRFGCLCLDRLVITIQEPPDGSSERDETLLARAKLPEATTAGVVCALAVVHSARLRRHVVRLRAKADALAGRMDADADAVPLADILALKRPVLGLGSVVDEELAALDVLKISRQAVLPLAGVTDAFQAAIENTRATERDIDRLDRRLSELQDRYEAAQQEKMNRQLGLLTVLSAIFMPLTVIVGIYGMNFEFMPELHYRYAYPIVLAGMALIAGGLYWYFRSRWRSKR